MFTTCAVRQHQRQAPSVLGGSSSSRGHGTHLLYRAAAAAAGACTSSQRLQLPRHPCQCTAATAAAAAVAFPFLCEWHCKRGAATAGCSPPVQCGSISGRHLASLAAAAAGARHSPSVQGRSSSCRGVHLLSKAAAAKAPMPVHSSNSNNSSSSSSSDMPPFL